MWQTIVTAMLTGGFFAFAQFLITRHDEKVNKKDNIKTTLKGVEDSLEALKKDIDKKFRKMEKDGLRTQLLFLLKMQPDKEHEILTVSEHYFKVLKGDWYMTTLFNQWLIDSNIGKPDWFDADD